MNKILAAVVATAFVFGSASGFAATSVKKEELTKEQRVEMRNRADKLTQERAQAPTTVKAPKATPAAKPAKASKTSKVTKAGGVHATKTQGKTAAPVISGKTQPKI